MRRVGRVGRLVGFRVRGRPVTETRVTNARVAVIEALQRVGGELRSDDGQATHELHRALGERVTAKALVQHLKRMEDAGLIEREVRGKRTYAISVIGGGFLRDGGPVTVQKDTDNGGKVSVPERRLPARPASGDTAIESPIRGPVDYTVLASALLDRVGEILAAGSPQDMEQVVQELELARQRLYATTEANQRQVAKMLALGEELAAVKEERDGLRTRLRAAEHNIQAMLKTGQVNGPGERAFKALERFMQEKPRGKG